MFLDEAGRRAFVFWEQANAKTGQIEIADRLTAELPEMHQRGGNRLWIDGAVSRREGMGRRRSVRDRVRATLSFALKNIQHQHGFLYHFISGETGQRAEFGIADRHLPILAAHSPAGHILMTRKLRTW